MFSCPPEISLPTLLDSFHQHYYSNGTRHDKEVVPVPFKRPLCFSHPDSSSTVLAVMNEKHPERYWLQAMELVANKQPLGCMIMWWCIRHSTENRSQICFILMFKFQISFYRLFHYNCAKWLKGVQCQHCNNLITFYPTLHVSCQVLWLALKPIS